MHLHSPKDKNVENQMNVNFATQEQLMTLRGVGKATAKKIVENRPFVNLDELQNKCDLSNFAVKQFEDVVIFVDPTPELPDLSEITLDEIMEADVEPGSPLTAQKVADAYRSCATTDPIEDFKRYEETVRAMLAIEPDSVTSRRITALNKKWAKIDGQGTWAVVDGILTPVTEKPTEADPEDVPELQLAGE